MKVLVVDDERTIANYVANELSSFGHRALPLYGPAEALDLVRVLHFDMAFLGIVMPGMNGLELGVRLRVMQPACKLVLMDVSDTVQAVKAKRPDFEYLAEPFEIKELLSKVQGTEIVRPGLSESSCPV